MSGDYRFREDTRFESVAAGFVGAVWWVLVAFFLVNLAFSSFLAKFG